MPKASGKNGAGPTPGRKLVRAGGIVLGVIAAAALFLIVLITTIDVVGRYFFSAPLPAAFEMIQILMAVLLFSGLPVVSGRLEHVTVGFADAWFKGMANRLRLMLVHLVSGALLGAAALFLWHHADRLGKAGEILTFLRAPVAPVIYFGSVMFALAAIILFVLAIAQILRRD